MNTVLVLGIVYLGVVAGMYVFQRSLLYFPDPTVTNPHDQQLAMDATQLKTPEGIKLVAWYGAARPGQKTIVYFHGNAQNLAARHNKFRTLMAEGFGLMAASYQGYSGSEGSPSEAGIYEDARTAIRALEAKGIPHQDMVLYGESLGTGVAVQMATEYPDVYAVVLEAPYTSVAARGQEIYPFIPVSLMLKDRFDTLSKIEHVKPPVLILHGEDDPVVPPRHSRILLEHIKAPHRSHYFPHIHHTDFPLETVASEVKKFVEDVPGMRPEMP
jgi:fermentation-respiration switch protein FrsA (DUF1100 family)